MGRQQDPLIFSIQHFCLHDGPGIRSLVFFKGCPLRCVWCQNPESWSTKQELGFKAHLCIDCRTCVSVCPEKAMRASGHRDHKLCRLCFTCASRCPSGALVCFGVSRSVGSVMEELRPEYPFYRASKGGVTFTGGEPTMFAGFVSELARGLSQEGIHLVLETCGHFNLERDLQPSRSSNDMQRCGTDGLRGPVWDLLSEIDLVLFDVKVFDDARHRTLCGTGNSVIKRNIHTLASLVNHDEGPAVWPRLPIVPGLTDTVENLHEWARFLLASGLSHLTLVPYHNLGESKRAWLGIKPGPEIRTPVNEALEAAREIMARNGINCYAPGEEDWSTIKIWRHRKNQIAG